MHALGLSSGNTKDMKSLSMVRHWDRVARSWSVQVTMVHVWFLVQNSETRGL